MALGPAKGKFWKRRHWVLQNESTGSRNDGRRRTVLARRLPESISAMVVKKNMALPAGATRLGG
ncbi:MAG: hypothetical protein ONB44_24500, partial [candidate division KSB1 bacterium]|nr:hypothetical protein [candidate division KSB1 bacterium]